MKKYVRCKACGFIMEEGKLGDRCPACGAPKTAFAPYVDTVGARRRALLNLQLHPVGVHFPVSFTAALLLFAIIGAFLTGDAKILLNDTIKVLGSAFPVVVIASGVLGYIDGKTRFRKIGVSAILKRKILYASLLLVLSAGITAAVWTIDAGSGTYSLVVGLLSAGSLGLVVQLGLLGTSILGAAFPGD